MTSAVERMATCLTFLTLTRLIATSTGQVVNPQVGEAGCATPIVDGTCQDICPTCVLGQGRIEECGFGEGTVSGCKICEPEKTYSKLYNRGSYEYHACERCRQCESTYLRETAEQCDIYNDTQCGICLPETHGVEPARQTGMTMFSCYPCGDDAATKQTQPMCVGYWKRIEKEAADAKANSHLKLRLSIGIPVFLACVGILIAAIIIYLKRDKITWNIGMCIKSPGIEETGGDKKALQESDSGGTDNLSHGMC